jgi:NADPH:quinone reductase-like Zn-dependent oxidoreductase
MGIFLGFRKPKRPILGMELAGEIEAVGSTVKRFKQGDQVFAPVGLVGFGSYAEYKCIAEDATLAVKPANLSFAEAAAVPIGAITALHFLRKANILHGKRVLVYGASGSVGSYAVQLARYYGAEVTGVCSTANLELVKSLGANTVVDYTKEDFTKNGKTYDVIFDTVGKSSFSACVRSLNKNGRYLLSDAVSLSTLVRSAVLSMTGSKKVITGMANESSEDLHFIGELIEAGEIKPVIDRCYPLDQMVEAHRYVDKGHKKGNVVITVNHKTKI